jgi:hypothetical protein
MAAHARWSWLVILGILAVAGAILYVSGSWLLAIVAAAGLTATLWQFFVPIDYEMDAIGLRLSALRRTRLVPWHAIHAFQLRSTGVVLYQRDDPAAVDLLRSLFVPYPNDPAEARSALRQYLSHAVELPSG